MEVMEVSVTCIAYIPENEICNQLMGDDTILCRESMKRGVLIERCMIRHCRSMDVRNPFWDRKFSLDDVTVLS